LDLKPLEAGQYGCDRVATREVKRGSEPTVTSSRASEPKPATTSVKLPMDVIEPAWIVVAAFAGP
jgi:hypothetical protein